MGYVFKADTLFLTSIRLGGLQGVSCRIPGIRAHGSGADAIHVHEPNGPTHVSTPQTSWNRARKLLTASEDAVSNEPSQPKRTHCTPIITHSIPLKQSRMLSTSSCAIMISCIICIAFAGFLHVAGVQQDKTCRDTVLLHAARGWQDLAVSLPLESAAHACAHV